MSFATLPRRYPLDSLVVLLAVVAEIKIWIVPGPDPKAVFIVGSLLWTLPLLLRHRFPFAAPVFTFAVQAGSAAAIPTLGVETTSLLALLLSFWVVGSHNDGGQAIAGAAIGFASIVVVAQLDRRVGPGDAVVGIVIGGVIWLIAYALRRRAQRADELETRASRLEREHEELVRARVAAERRRIARDLHDVIAHSLSVMIVQAGAARLLLDDEPERARTSAFAVEETGHQALVEVRRLLGMLGKEEPGLAPRPGLSALNALVEHTRAAGLPVEVRVEGEPHGLPPGIDLTAYRIVQEALTNALRHAGPVRTEVRVSYEGDGLLLEIANDRGRGSNGGGGSGHGLVGMRERAALYGGELHCGPRAIGGYVVRARLPVEVAQP
jgi:signal transduction histidine kinase